MHQAVTLRGSLAALGKQHQPNKGSEYTEVTKVRVNAGFIYSILSTHTTEEKYDNVLHFFPGQYRGNDHASAVSEMFNQSKFG